jgi:hypothetical protein
MNNINKLVKYFEGKKTYIIGAVTFCYGIYQGFIATGGNWKTFVPWLLSAAGLTSLRAAYAKSKSK